jgi:cation diffusion facilitator family transporter
VSASEQALEPEARIAGVRRALVITLLLNLAVAAAKIVYGVLHHALSIRADGFHSLTDASNNVAGLIAVWLAARPPDPGHPYGHRKFEVIAAGFVGLSLLAMAYDVIRSAIERLVEPAAHLPEIDSVAFVVLLGTLAVNVGVARYERRVGRELKSSFLLSDAAHTASDSLVTVTVLVAVIFVRFGYGAADLVAALGVAVFIGWVGIGVLRRNFAYLADAARVEPERIDAIVRAVPGVAGSHKIRTRGLPGAISVDLHIQIARHLNVVQAHQVTHWVIDAIRHALPEVLDVVVHTEPAREGEPYAPLPEEMRE